MTRNEMKRSAPKRVATVAADSQGPQSRPLRRQDWIFALALAAFTMLAYLPAWDGQLLWDDSGHVTKPELRSVAGLKRIWIEPGATQQYYPLLHTSFWIAQRLWGDSLVGYHLLSLVLHVLSALLLFRLLRKLEIPGAPLAAALFALHPVQVESVAWISELKNTLSAFLCLSAALIYLRYRVQVVLRRRSTLYAMALGVFALGLLSKTTIATLPAALLVTFWWKRGELSWKRDALPLLPFIALGALSGIVTAWVERAFIGATGADFGFSVVERTLIAGRAFWFYLGKLVWPQDLTFIYPRWDINQAIWWQYLFPLSALGLIFVLWLLRRRSRGPLAACLVFGGTLFPALGFFNVYPFIYSFVADHFQYLACIAPFTLSAAAIANGLGRIKRWEPRMTQCLALALLAALGVATWQQSKMYANPEKLWTTTLERNPGCWMAFDNLGVLWREQGKRDKAFHCFQSALRLKPDDYTAHDNLGLEFYARGMTDQALAHLKEALRIAPYDAPSYCNLGMILQEQGNVDAAIDNYRKAIHFKPSHQAAHFNLGMALLQKGRPDAAMSHFEICLQSKPDDAEAEYRLGFSLQEQGRTAAAILHYRRSLEILPGYRDAAVNLGRLLFRTDQFSDAIVVIEKVVSSNPPAADTPDLLATLSTAYARAGRYDSALGAAAQALSLPQTASNPPLANALRKQIELYRMHAFMR